MLKIEKLHKSYPIGDSSLHVLKGIDLFVEKGEMVAIMGSSGSGKSTLLNIIGMLDEADEGNYILDEVPIKNLSEKKAAIYRNKFLGFIFQSFNLINYKNALENVADAQKNSNELSKAYELGIENDLSKVMVSQQISSLGFQFTLNARNKVLSAYKDIMNMPV